MTSNKRISDKLALTSSAKPMSKLLLTGVGLVAVLLAISTAVYGWSRITNLARETDGSEDQSGSPHNAAASQPTELNSNQASALSVLPDPTAGIDATAPLSLGAFSSQSLNGIELSASNFRRDGEYVKVDVCHDLPSTANWQLGIPVLEVGSARIMAREFNLINWETSADGSRTGRCDWVSFPVPANTDLSQMSIIVERLETSAAEQPDCAIAQQKLDAAQSGIVIHCEQGVSGFNYAVVERPASMTDEVMYRLIGESFIEIIDGPWVLTGSFR